MTLMDEIRSITREIATLKPRSRRRIVLEARLINLKVKQLRAEDRAEKRKAA